jgi:hypothetical protein
MKQLHIRSSESIGDLGDFDKYKGQVMMTHVQIIGA